MRHLYVFIYFIHQCYSAGIMDHIVFAVNCGGDAHTDENGIRYRRDFLKSGIATDYGRHSYIHRVSRDDMILYQTERYDLKPFSYEIELNTDGDYVLWMKFSEVWFNGPNLKVFQVLLNDEHSVIDELDIFAKVGRATAHDEYVPFQIKNDRLVVKSHSSSYSGKLKITFHNLPDKDNPKVNAIIIWKGSIDKIPKLLPMSEPDEGMGYDEDEPPSKTTKLKRSLKPSGPQAIDPYLDEQSSSFIPLLIAVAAAIPVIFCLCRL